MEKTILNPFDYQAHVDYISFLISNGDILEARNARNTFSTYFPLTEELWLEWINDEKGIACSPDEKMFVIELFNRAKNDYSAIEIYAQFLEYLKDEFEICREENLDWLQLQQVLCYFEQAVDDTKWHFASSHVIWNSYKDFLLSVDAKSVTQMRNIFIDRLKIPHLHIDETFNEYSSFENKYDPANYIQNCREQGLIVNETKKQCSKREKFESALGDNSLEAYKAYLTFEIAHGSPGQVCSLFERMICIYCLNPDVWNEYIIYMVSRNLKTQTVLERATRNCPYDQRLWEHFLLCNTEVDPDEIYQKGLGFLIAKGNPTEVGSYMGAYLVFQSRRNSPEDVRKWFKDSLRIKSQLGVDMEAKFDRSMGFVECYIFKDKVNCCAVYDGCLKRFHSVSDIWREYIVCMSFGDLEKQRELYRIASSKKLNDNTLMDDWVQFEYLHGDLNQIYEAKKRRLAMYNRVKKDSLKRGFESEDQQLQKRPKIDNEPKESNTETVVEKKEKIDKPILEYKTIDNSNAGNMIYLENLDSKITEEMIKSAIKPFGRIMDFMLQPNAETGILECFIEFADTESVRKIAQSALEIASFSVIPQRCIMKEKWSFSTERQNNVLFVSNLPPKIDKMMIREFFKGLGKIVEIRCNIKQNGTFAYVEFESRDMAEKALIRDQQTLAGNVINVAIADPSKRKKLEVDPRKLCINNLPYTFLEHDVRQIFEKFGKLESLHLATFKNRFQGTAFVTFEKQEDATNALSLNSTNIQGRVVNVSIADPNKRRDKKVFENAAKASRNQKQAEFVPRVHKVHHRKLLNLNETKSTKSDETPKMKSQDDFRQMLLKK